MRDCATAGCHFTGSKFTHHKIHVKGAGRDAATALAVVSDAVHVLAAGGWLGGLLVTIAVGVPAAIRLGDGKQGDAVAALVNAFSPTALVFGGTVVATGSLAAWPHVDAIDALWTTGYGRTLLLKVGLLSALFATGAYTFLRVRPALGTDTAKRRLHRSSAFELTVAVLVILVTAVLVAMPLPRDTGRQGARDLQHAAGR